MIGIYKITHKISQKSYIGQSKHCGLRLDQHCKGQQSQFIDDVISLEGIEAFSFEIIKKTEEEDLSFWEDYYIMKYNTMFPNGYNKKWNTSNQIRQTIKMKLEEDLKKEKQASNEVDIDDIENEDKIVYLFNKTLFDIYLKLFYMSIKDKNYYFIDNRKMTGLYLQNIFPDISYATILKYLKILKELKLIEKQQDITIIQNIDLITKYISKAEYNIANEYSIYLWYIKYKIKNYQCNIFFRKNFSWIYSMYSVGTHDGSGNYSKKLKEAMNTLSERGLIKLGNKTSVYKYEVNFI